MAAFHRELAPRLFAQLEETAVLVRTGSVPDQVWVEWECFALYACVRGLVAAGGFNRETAAAIDAMLEAAAESGEARQRIAERFAEYGAIGQEGGKSGAATVTQRLGLAAARHMAGAEEVDGSLAELVGQLHESLAEGAAEAVRRGS
jgi:hypothetical protein